MAHVVVVPTDPPGSTWEAVAGAFSARHDVRLTSLSDPRLEEWIDHADVPLYHVDGDDSRSEGTYHLAARRPGLVVLHDLDLEGLVRAMVRRGDPLAESALREAAADRARIPVQELGGRARSLTPWCAQLLRRSRGVVVHSAFIARYLAATRVRTPVFVAPHPVVGGVDERRARTLRGELPPSEVVAVALCDPSASRWIGELVAATPESMRVVVVGSAAEVAGTAERVTVPESRDEVRSWVAASDVVVNLGHPGWTEARDFMAAAQAAGRPTLATEPWLVEGIPSDAVVAVGPMPTSDEMRTALETLLRDRDALGAKVRDDALARCTPEAAADVYARAVDATIALLGDPMRDAVRRWAAGLAEFGATVDTARQGLGARFAEELATIAEAT